MDNKGGYGTWIPGPDGEGQYAVPTFMNYDNNGNATTTTGSYGEAIARRYAPIGQGFDVKAYGEWLGNGNRKLNGNLQKTSTVSTFRKGQLLYLEIQKTTIDR